MKKIFLIAMLSIFGLSDIANAQPFALEHTYDSAATYNYCQTPGSQLMIIDFEVSGERYVKINRCGKKICIYDMNHALLKSIYLGNLPGDFNYYNNVGDILYLSEHLFNDDPNIEFMYNYSTSNGKYVTNIYNEKLILLFSDTSYPFIRINFPSQQYPIYNTTYGTKMLLSCNNGQARVFSLPGVLTTAIQDGNNILLNQYASNLKLSNPYPNPAENTTQIDYTLPKGETEGEIILYSLTGVEIKRFRVDKTFNTLLISTADIEAGTYYYQLQTANENSSGKKMVVIK